MACFIKSENNSAEGILNLLEFSHIAGQQGYSLYTEEFTNIFESNSLALVHRSSNVVLNFKEYCFSRMQSLVG